MTLPPGFAGPDEHAIARPLVALDRVRLPDFLATQPARMRRWCETQNFSADPATVLPVPDADGATACVLVGIANAADPHALAHAPYALAAGAYRLDGKRGLHIDPQLAHLGWGLGTYRFERYRKPLRAPARLLVDDAIAGDSEAFALLRACTRVRDLINTPTEDMGPDELEAAAREIAQAHGASLHVVTGEDLLKRNFPAIHAVGRASHRAPRLIELSWGEPTHPHIAIVGKGVCFDTGGLDLKPADGMRWMKKDMGGAAHALALAELLMARALPLRITLLIPAVENAVGPNAFRPGEVVATRRGISVEIDNTDAEGRMVLCDALTYAVERGPAVLLDFATLTGAARIALGPELPALYANDDSLANDWLAAGIRVFDPLWRMPLHLPYLGYLRSTIADLSNCGASRMAGSITAALYLQRFVPDTLPWAHLDVYAWNDAERPGHPAGGEAQGLRAAFAMLKARYAR